MTTRAQSLKFASELLERVLDHLRSECIDDDRIDLARMDARQIVLFDVALCAAELAAARSLDAAAADLDTGAVEPGLAGYFVAEAIASLGQRLAARSKEYGLPSELAMSHDVEALSSDAIVRLGERLLDLDGSTGRDPLDEEKRLMRATFRQFADEKVAPLAAEIHRQNLTVPDEIVDGLRALGCFGLSVPEAYGGLRPDEGDDSLGMVVATEELSRGSLGAAGSLITRPEIMARALLAGGSGAQKSLWLPRLARGEPLCAISVTEPGTGSDVAAVRLRATRVEGGWLLNGAKTWCTLAGKAGVMLVLARTDPDASPPHRGLSLFIVEKPSTDALHFEHRGSGGGVVTGRAIPTLGYRGMHSFEIFYDDFFVPAENLLGEEAGEGRGFYHTMTGFAGGRLQTAARACGLMQAAYESALRYAGERRVFGRAVADYPLTRAKLVRMAALISASRHFSYDVARLLDAGEGQMEASLVKLFACRAAEWVTREALQIHGGLGYAEESDVSRYFVDARVLPIFEGAEETLALRVVARELLQR
jgi:(2S)-methylsuccinyl-CoA dehydrogenase